MSHYKKTTRSIDLAASAFAQCTQWPSILSKKRRNPSRNDEMTTISLQSSSLTRILALRSHRRTGWISELVRSFSALNGRSIGPSLVANDRELPELESLQCSSPRKLATVADRKKAPPVLSPKWVLGGRPLGGGGGSNSQFCSTIRNMSVGRFQLALRALDLRAAPCPRGLVRPSGSLAGDPTSWGLTPPWAGR